MMMSRVKDPKARSYAGKSKQQEQRKKPQLEEYVTTRDYTGAIALLEFTKNSEDATEETLKWLGYCSFHLGEYRKALEAYEELSKMGQGGREVHLWMACCLFYLQLYKEAEEAANRGPECALQNRVLFHTAHKMNDEVGGRRGDPRHEKRGKTRREGEERETRGRRRSISSNRIFPTVYLPTEP